MDIFSPLKSRQVLFIGGKGGVGKTTSACALALYLARESGKTLLISTDPAHSIGDAFNQKLQKRTAITPTLDAQEIHPDAVLNAHMEKVANTMAAYSKKELMPKLLQFLELSKDAPGAQEAAMFEAICQTLHDGAHQGYKHIVFDNAPTGHSLRLLNLPEIMQAYTSALLNSQLSQQKFQQAAQHLGAAINAPQETRFAAAQQALKARQHLFAHARQVFQDPERAAIILVMLAEKMVLAETKRAVAQLKTANMAPLMILVNQLLGAQNQDPFWHSRQQRQQQIIQELQAKPLAPLLFLPLQAQDISGTEALVAFLQTARAHYPFE